MSLSRAHSLSLSLSHTHMSLSSFRCLASSTACFSKNVFSHCRSFLTGKGTSIARPMSSRVFSLGDSASVVVASRSFHVYR